MGKCEDEEIQKRFDQLVLATGLNPSCEITAESYVTRTGRSVQYGEAITIVLTLDITEFGLGNFKIPIPRPNSVKTSSAVNAILEVRSWFEWEK